MDTRQLEITCPCCSTRLLVDVRSETVLRARKPGQTDAEGKPKVGEADWSSALSKVKDRETSGTGKLDAFLDSERTKQARLDERFREAQKKLRESDADQDTEP